jgi:hypothetical protein
MQRCRRLEGGVGRGCRVAPSPRIHCTSSSSSAPCGACGERAQVVLRANLWRSLPACAGRRRRRRRRGRCRRVPLRRVAAADSSGQRQRVEDQHLPRGAAWLPLPSLALPRRLPRARGRPARAPAPAWAASGAAPPSCPPSRLHPASHCPLPHSFASVSSPSSHARLLHLLQEAGSSRISASRSVSRGCPLVARACAALSGPTSFCPDQRRHLAARRFLRSLLLSHNRRASSVALCRLALPSTSRFPALAAAGPFPPAACSP